MWKNQANPVIWGVVRGCGARVQYFVVVYEDRLRADTRWALAEGSRHFEDRSAVHDSLRRITARLDQLGIAYAVAGGMALFVHGYRRFTEDIDLLVTRDGLAVLHDALDGLGYVRAFPGARSLRDADSGVRIEFLVAGDFPGDGKPKPVAFPDPVSVVVEMDGVRYLSLPALIELKLASGMTSPGRLRDLADVMELIRQRGLDVTFQERLNPWVRAKYAELFHAGNAPTRNG